MFLKKFDEEGQADFVTRIEAVCAKLDKQVGDDKKWCVGEKISIADCVYSFFFHSFVYNEGLPGGAVFTDKA